MRYASRGYAYRRKKLGLLGRAGAVSLARLLWLSFQEDLFSAVRE
jgi:hypothetical protein